MSNKHLMVNQTADGSSESFRHMGGDAAVYAWGNFGGGILTLEVLTPDGVTWVRADGNVWSDGVCRVINKLPPCTLRVTLSGSVTPNLSCSIFGY